MGKKIIKKYQLTERDVDRIVEMAWEDRTPFDAIAKQFGLKEAEVIKVMRYEMKLSSWKMWRKTSTRALHQTSQKTGGRREPFQM